MLTRQARQARQNDIEMGHAAVPTSVQKDQPPGREVRLSRTSSKKYDANPTRKTTQRTRIQTRQPSVSRTDVGTEVLPGSNNQHTACGRRIDPWQRDFNGHRSPSLLERDEEAIEDQHLDLDITRHLTGGGSLTKGYLTDGFVTADNEASDDEEWSGSEDEEEEDEEEDEDEDEEEEEDDDEDEDDDDEDEEEKEDDDEDEEEKEDDDEDEEEKEKDDNEEWLGSENEDEEWSGSEDEEWSGSEDEELMVMKDTIEKLTAELEEEKDTAVAELEALLAKTKKRKRKKVMR